MIVNFFVIEDLSSGLFRTQVLDLARSICMKDSQISIRIISINRIWKIWSHLSSLKQYKKETVNLNISIVYFPWLPPLRSVVSNPILSEFLIALLRLSCWLSKLFGRVDLWHARGYWTTIALHRNRENNILFDPRSLWIQENQSAGNITPNSKALRYWFENEKYITEASSHITVVSDGMRNYLATNYKNPVVSVIPISAKAAFFEQTNEVRIKRRSDLGWENNFIFVYSGSLGISGVNAVSLIKLFDYILSLENSRLLILTEESDLKIDRLLDKINKYKSKIRVVKPFSSEIPEWLCCSDVGVHALSAQLDSATRLGTKVIEYWAAGLPVLINNHVGAACQAIESNDYLGFIVNFNSEMPDINFVVNRLESKSRNLIQAFAKKNYSSEVVAGKYLLAYKIMAEHALIN